MKNLGFSVLAAVALLVTSSGYSTVTDTKGNRTTKATNLICDCTTIAVTTTDKDTETNTTGSNVPTPV